MDEKSVSAQLITKMRDTMYSRGPDDAGVWMDGSVGLAHRRLSIIDISSLGHQPMVDGETGSVITYNGEVYNYKEIRKELEGYGIKFKSQTDTEVVLKAYRKWGRECVKKFNGMFSFAIWDSKKRGIFIARDRMGIKPLYYYHDNDLLIFASRLNALMIHPRCPSDIDYESLGLYLDMGFVPAPWSIIKGVKKLQPGHALWVDKKSIAKHCYWSLDSIIIDNSLKDVSENELIDRLDVLLNDSVKLHLASDVPLGTFLSGGIDSSLITAIMCQYSQSSPKTFTIGFDEKPYDESGYAEKIAQFLGTNHHSKRMEGQDLLSLFDDNTANFDEPLADWSSLPTMMVSRFAKEQVTVCLTGDGGDELFAGYHFYPILFSLQHLYRLPHALRFLLGQVAAKISSRKFAIVGQSFSQKDILSSFAFMRSMTRPFNSQSLLAQGIQGETVEGLFRKRCANFGALDEVSKTCRLDAAYYLTDDILQKVDVASMSTSLEARVPILDHRIVEFSQSLPIKFKLRGLNTKWILKKVLAKYIPEKLFKRPKRGFVAPFDSSSSSRLKEIIQDELSIAQIKQFGYLNPGGVQKLIDSYLLGGKGTDQLLWALLCLVRWDRRFR